MLARAPVSRSERVRYDACILACHALWFTFGGHLTPLSFFSQGSFLDLLGLHASFFHRAARAKGKPAQLDLLLGGLLRPSDLAECQLACGDAHRLCT